MDFGSDRFIDFDPPEPRQDLVDLELAYDMACMAHDEHASWEALMALEGFRPAPSASPVPPLPRLPKVGRRRARVRQPVRQWGRANYGRATITIMVHGPDCPEAADLVERAQRLLDVVAEDDRRENGLP